ncbi:MAG: response regulator transcription factor [Bacteroidales bacterium]|nr:response regulator transcription factor [Bacteroidales bacterium]
MAANKVYKVLIAEPYDMISEGMTSLLKSSDSFTVVGRVDSMDRLMERLPYFRPDVLIINPIMVDFSKRWWLHSIFESFAQLTIVALHYQYIDSNILKQYHGIISLEDNKMRIESKLKEALSMKNDISENYELSKREIDVLIAVAKGMINKDIADKLNISIHTVISHRKNITRKTGIKSVSGLTVYALLNNLIAEGDVQ